MAILTDVVGVSPSLYYTESKTHIKQSSKAKRREISRLISAAVISKTFCQLLLSNPGKALDYGFQGETFFLNSVEKNKILSIKANSLADFAAQLTS
jgi:hypothetical protein